MRQSTHGLYKTYPVRWQSAQLEQPVCSGFAHPEMATPMLRSVLAVTSRISSRARLGSIKQPPTTQPMPAMQDVQIAWFSSWATATLVRMSIVL